MEIIMGDYANRSLMVLFKVSWAYTFTECAVMCVLRTASHGAPLQFKRMFMWVQIYMCVPSERDGVPSNTGVCTGSEKPLRSLLMAADTVKWSINPEQSCDKQGVTAEEESHRSASAQL